MIGACSRENPRLNPSRLSNRYYILTLLRSALESVVGTYLAARRDLTLVDIGCGSMPYRPLFQSHVATYVGVDLPENSRAAVKTQLDNPLPLPSAGADVILSTQVLEHLTDPSQHLRECHRILKSDGLLILSTHGYWRYHPDPKDFWRWTSEGLRKLISDTGFQIDHWRGLMSLASTGVYLLQDGLTPTVPRAARRPFWLAMQLTAMAIDRLYSNDARSADACVFLLCAHKRPPLAAAGREIPQ